MTKLEVAATKFAEKNHSWLKDALPTLAAMKSFKAGAEWRNNNLWHDAQGDDLPEIDREVIVLYQPYPLENSDSDLWHRWLEYSQCGVLARLQPAREMGRERR